MIKLMKIAALEQWMMSRLLKVLWRRRLRKQRRIAMAEDCPSVERLATYLDHNLDAAEVTAMEAHLAECHFCRRVVLAVVQSRQAVPDPVIPETKRKLFRW